MNPRARRLILAAFVMAASPVMMGLSCINLSSFFDRFRDLTRVMENISKNINDRIEEINQTMSQAVNQLGQQSSSWQGTLTTLEADLAQHTKELEEQTARHAADMEKLLAKRVDEQREKAARDVLELERQLVSDAHDLIRQVSTVAKDGVQFSQESINCQADIFSSHARVAVQNLLIAFLNKRHYQGKSDRPFEPYVPIVCSANPDNINVAKWDPSTALILSGTDLSLFDSQRPSIVVLRRDQSSITISNVGNRVTNYRFAINVQAMIEQGRLENAVQLQVHWNGQKVNQNEIPVAACGNYGQPCCRIGQLCKSGTCVNGTCTSCGAIGQACCNGNACTAGRCANNICSPCGSIGQVCCGGDSCSSGECWHGLCVTCGRIGQPCCHGDCSSGVCQAETCVPCGDTGEACCTTGSPCGPGDRCVAGVCSSCGAIGERCCSSGSSCRVGQCVNDYCRCGAVGQVCCPGSSCAAGLSCQANRCRSCHMETRSTTDYFTTAVSLNMRNRWGFTNVTIPGARPGDTITIVRSYGRVCFDDCDSECGDAEVGHGSGEAKSCGIDDDRYHRLAIEAGGRTDHAISMRQYSWTNTTNEIGLCAEDDKHSDDNCGTYSVELQIARLRQWQEQVCN